ncbi:TPA: hypothetical protein NV714_001730 [Escherichia coli]|nr:hypothetical protein [Escherichia coli]
MFKKIILSLFIVLFSTVSAYAVVPTYNYNLTVSIYKYTGEDSIPVDDQIYKTLDKTFKEKPGDFTMLYSISSIMTDQMQVSQFSNKITNGSVIQSLNGELYSYGDVENKKILNVNYEVKTLDLQFKTEQRYLIKNDSDFNKISYTFSSKNVPLIVLYKLEKQ